MHRRPDPDDGRRSVVGLTTHHRDILPVEPEVDGDAPSDAVRALLTRTGEPIATTTAPVWAGLPADDVAATQRTLEAVVARARVLLRD